MKAPSSRSSNCRPRDQANFLLRSSTTMAGNDYADTPTTAAHRQQNHIHQLIKEEETDDHYVSYGHSSSPSYLPSVASVAPEAMSSDCSNHPTNGSSNNDIDRHHRIKKPRGIRVPLSCDPCRRWKKKCDRNQPCSSCIKRKEADLCKYSPQTAKKRETTATASTSGTHASSACCSGKSEDLSSPALATPMSVSSTPGATTTEGAPPSQPGLGTLPKNVEIQFQEIQVSIDNLERLLEVVRRRNLETSSSDSSPYGRTPNSSSGMTSVTTNLGSANAPSSVGSTSAADINEDRDQLVERLNSRINKLKTSLDTNSRDPAHAQLKVPTFEWNALVDQVNFLKDAFRKGQDRRLFPRPHSSDSIGIFSGFPFFQNSPLLPEQIVAQLPPKSLCDFLLESYFKTSYVIFRVVYEPRVRDMYNKLWTNIDLYRRATTDTGRSTVNISLTSIALMCSLSCTAALYLGDDNVQFERHLRSAGWDVEQESHVAEFINSLRVLSLQSLVADNFLIDYSVATVQTLVICLDGMLHSSGEDGPSWPIFGMVCNMAVSLGCNADRRELSGLKPIEIEERKRCWAGILLLENMQLCLFGRPIVMWRPDTTLPLNINDEDLAASANLEVLERTSDYTRLTQMTFMLLKVKVGGMFSSIHTRMRKKQLLEYNEVREVDLAVAESVREWDIPYRIQKGYSQNSSIKYDMLRNFVDQNLLVLHRPYYFTHPESRQRCIDSARAIAHRIYRFSNTPEYQPFRSYVRGIGAFYCFHAAVVLAISAAQEWMESHNSQSDVMRDFEMAADSIERMNELSPNLMLITKSASVVRTVRETLTRVMADPSGYRNVLGTAESGVSSRMASPMGASPQLAMGNVESSSSSITSPHAPVPDSNVQSPSHQRQMQQQQVPPNMVKRQPSVDALDQILGTSATDAYQWLSPNDVNWQEWESLSKSLPEGR